MTVVVFFPLQWMVLKSKFSFSIALIIQKCACFVLELSQTFAPGKGKKAKIKRISSGLVWKAAEYDFYQLPVVTPWLKKINKIK